LTDLDDFPLDPERLDELWDFGNPAASAERFRTEMQLCAGNATATAELTTQLARAEGLQGHHVAAEQLLASLPGDAPGLVGIRVHLEKGRLLNSAGRPADAVPHFRRALESALAQHELFLAADAVHMLAIAEPERAPEWTRQGLGLIATSPDPRLARWAGSLRNNLGWQLFETGDPDGALRQFEAAVEAYSRYGKPDQVLFARWAMARTLRALNRIEEALDIQLELLRQDPADPYVHEELAELHAAGGAAELAGEHRSRAEELRAGPRVSIP
jgi:tetratricopeptide (TPR) repeat protein